MKKRELSCTIGGNVNWYRHYGRQYRDSLKKKTGDKTTISSVQFSCSVVSDFLRPHESQHTRPPCPSPTPRVHSDSRPSSQRCHPAISSSVIPFSSCPQSLPASESFLMSQLYDPAVPLLGIYPEETKIEKLMYLIFHCSTIYIS